jgi:co-chaperonin GroES (HSP10)
MKAIGINIVIEPITEEKTEGGILMPTGAVENTEGIVKGKVLSVGNGTYLGGKVDMEIKEGDVLYYRGTTGSPYITPQGKKYRVLNLQDVIGYD